MIKRPSAFDFHWNTKELLLTLYYLDENGMQVLDSDTIGLGRSAAQQMFKEGNLYANTKLASDKDNEPKPLKPDQPTITEQEK